MADFKLKTGNYFSRAAGIIVTEIILAFAAFAYF